MISRLLASQRFTLCDLVVMALMPGAFMASAYADIVLGRDPSDTTTTTPAPRP